MTSKQKDALVGLLGHSLGTKVTFQAFQQALKPVHMRVQLDTVLTLVLDRLMLTFSKFIDAAVAEFREADSNSDGMLSELEFVRYVLSIIPTRHTSECQAAFAAVMDAVDPYRMPASRRLAMVRCSLGAMPSCDHHVLLRAFICRHLPSFVLMCRHLSSCALMSHCALMCSDVPRERVRDICPCCDVPRACARVGLVLWSSSADIPAVGFADGLCVWPWLCHLTTHSCRGMIPWGVT